MSTLHPYCKQCDWHIFVFFRSSAYNVELKDESFYVTDFEIVRGQPVAQWKSIPPYPFLFGAIFVVSDYQVIPCSQYYSKLADIIHCLHGSTYEPAEPNDMSSRVP